MEQRLEEEEKDFDKKIKAIIEDRAGLRLKENDHIHMQGFDQQG